MTRRRLHRQDANEPEIVKAVRKAGALWHDEGPLDGWMGARGIWWCVEIKDGSKPPSARKLTPNEEDVIRTMQDYKLPVIVAVSPTDLLTQAGLI